jgi:ribosomal protein S19
MQRRALWRGLFPISDRKVAKRSGNRNRKMQATTIRGVLRRLLFSLLLLAVALAAAD